MCLLGISFRAIPGCPLFVLANREEAYARAATTPTTQPACDAQAGWLGGVDLIGGGTWLGVNRMGLVAAVTNRRSASVPARPISRGLLCRALLACSEVSQAVDLAQQQLRGGHFAGCNLLIGSAASACVIEFGDQLRVTELAPGWHLLTNGALNDAADKRIARVRAELQRASASSIADWASESERICSLRGNATDVPICLAGADRGTVSSTILALADEGARSLYRFAEEAPLPGEYHDLSPSLRELLASERSAETAHRIRLREPWQAMPGTTADGVRLTRNFNRPTNLTDSDRVLVTFQDARDTGPVRVNGRWMGAVSPLEACQAFDLTVALAAHNCLEVEFGANAVPQAARPSERLGQVALEIRQR